MKTLIIISHPTIEESNTQQFMRESLPESGVTWHHLEKNYPDGKFDVQEEQKLLREHDRILFQFPLYWYSSPPLLKQWQDEILAEGFTYGKNGSRLAGKEFGLVISTGVREEEYQPGASEHFTIAELTRPFQAMAYKCQLDFLPVFLISRFEYMTAFEQRKLLVDYRQYLSKKNDSSLAEKERWFKEELLTLGKKDISVENQQLVDLLIDMMEENRDQLDDLVWTLQEMKE